VASIENYPRTSPVVGPAKPRLLGVLGPGLITGASDDDPSGIATYSQAGAQFGFGTLWLMVFSYPLMAAIQQISAHIGRVTGRGIAGNICRHYPAWLLQAIVGLVFVANTINIAADLGAMGDVASALAGGPHMLYVVLFGLVCAVLQVFMQYTRYVSVLKWTTLSLFTYFGTAMMVNVPWGEVVEGLVIPKLSLDAGFVTMVVAVIGTTISPYLFFWQSSQEAEDQRTKPQRDPLIRAPEQAPEAMERIRLDTYVGMAFANLVALAIMITTAATLHNNGVTDIQSSADAAKALEPVAGKFAFAIFALGIVGTGLLAVPVLAGSAAYAVGESRRWPVGLARRPIEAKAFYATVAVATILGILINFSPVNPIRALFWSAVINGVVAVPVMVVMMLMTGREAVMGRFVVKGPLRLAGWTATAVMTLAALGMGAVQLL
jgi:NRAMP (natural resistance-associated macrophage protein)-like metal ion transporter